MSVFVTVLYCSDYCSFVIQFKSGSVPSILLLFLKIALAVCGLLWFHTCFSIVFFFFFFISVKTVTGVLVALLTDNSHTVKFTHLKCTI